MKRPRWDLRLMLGGGVFCLFACGENPEMKPENGALIDRAGFPWETYQAEDMRIEAEVRGPSRVPGTPEAEAVGRRMVRLERTGDYVEFSSRKPANTILLRHSIPDAGDGGGRRGTVSLYVNGAFRQKVHLDSRLAWVYGDFPGSNDPSQGKARHVFTEDHAMVAPIAAGDSVRLQKDADDTLPWIHLDLVELERAPPPLPRPENSLSILDFGATSGDDSNDADALIRCMEAALKSGQTVWIPPGTFRLDAARLPAYGVRLQGAGIWHSRLTGSTTMFDGTGEAVHVADLAIFGEVDRRVDHLQTNAFNGNLGDGSVFERIWIEHMKCGFWTTFGTRNMILRDSRIRNLKADGLNFCDGTVGSVVERCHFRNTGDDALATWSARDGAGKPCRGNRFTRNWIQQPWMANGIAIYGGADHVVSGNLIEETVISGAGILVSSGFNAYPFEGTIRVENNRIVGAGGDCYIGEQVGGLWFHAKDEDVAAQIEVRNLEIIDSHDSAISIHGPREFESIRLENITIAGAAKAALEAMPGARATVHVREMEFSGVPEGKAIHHEGSAVNVVE